MIMRILDIIVSCIGLFLLLLMLPWVGLLIRIDSQGPFLSLPSGWQGRQDLPDV